MKSRRSAAHLRPVDDVKTCPQCGSDAVSTSYSRHTFTYGSDDSAVDLTVKLPVRRCDSCKFEYLDEEAERLEHEAICRHFGVLAPAEIRRIRKRYGMTRAAFAQITGLGEASLNRWENGVTIQTHANDRYLRLLARPENMVQLRNQRAAAPDAPVPGGDNERFRVLAVSDAIRREQESFQLRRAG